MIRLITAKNSDDVTLRVEGELVADSVTLMEEECQRLRRICPTLHVDLSGVTYVDAHGVTLLRALSAAGVTLGRCPPLIRLALAED
jgi:ABC-type transporter Mla MlaB component